MAHRIHRVESEAALRADGRAALRIYVYSALAAGLVTLILYYL